jgi:hypothetical protein
MIHMYMCMAGVVYACLPLDEQMHVQQILKSTMGHIELKDIAISCLRTKQRLLHHGQKAPWMIVVNVNEDPYRL